MVDTKINDENLEEINQNATANITVANSDLNSNIDHSLLSLPLEEAEQQLVAKIIEAPTRDDLRRQFDLFNMNQSKKNALRIIKLNNLLTKVEDQAIERFEKRPDQVSNKELLEYMNVVSGQIDRAQKQIDTLNVTPTINMLNQKNEVNINVGGQELDRDSKERVMDAISALLKQVRTATSESADDEEVTEDIQFSETPQIIDPEEMSEVTIINASETEE